MSRQFSIFFGFLLLTGIAASAAEPKWIRLPSSDFEIFSTATEGATTDVLHHFEEVRSFFKQMSKGHETVQAEPVRIILFSSEKEYLPYRPNDFAAAFYTQIAGRDYIVMSSAAENVFPIAVHEYVHLVAQHEGLHLPPWANEGIADLFSTLKPQANKILLGSLIEGHVIEIVQNSWVPLATILGAGQDSPYYNEKKKAGAFYAESWALIHLLMLEPQYAPKYPKLIDALVAGTPSQQAVETIYGKPLSAFDKELPSYITGGRLTGGLVPATLQEGAKVHSQPAQPFDVKLALLDLLSRPGKEAERQKGLQDLAAEYPQRPEPHSALGYLAWRSSKNQDAMKEFKAAIDLGSRNPQMLWDYGRMVASQDDAESIRVLSLLLAVDANRVDVRLTLAQVQENDKQYKEAMTTLGEIRKVGPEDAPKLFRMIAYASVNTNDMAEAKTAAHRWQDTAKTDEDKANAARMVQYLDAADAAKKAPVTRNVTPLPAPGGEGTSGDSGLPVLRRATPTTTVPETAPVVRKAVAKPSVAGSFVEFNCVKTQPRFVLSTAEGNVSFLMDDPLKVFIRGRDSTTIELYCGAQKEKSMVWIEYDPPPASEGDVRGIARVVHFEAPGADAGH